MNKSEIRDRAHNKAFSKIMTLQRDVSRLNDEIRAGGDGRISLDTLKDCVRSTRKDLQTWQYIAKLIELYGYK